MGNQPTGGKRERTRLLFESTAERPEPRQSEPWSDAKPEGKSRSLKASGVEDSSPLFRSERVAGGDLSRFRDSFKRAKEPVIGRSEWGPKGV